MNDAARHTKGQIVVIVCDGHTMPNSFPAEPGNHTSLFDDLGQALDDDTQHLVAQAMSVQIVDRLEVVQIDHEHGTTLVLGDVGRAAVELLEKAPPVREYSQGIVTGEPLRLTFGHPPLTHLLAKVADAARREDDGGDADEEQKGDEFIYLGVFS